MHVDTSGDLDPPARRSESPTTITPDSLVALVRADRAAHDVAQTSLGEFDGEIDLYPENHDQDS